MVTAATILKTLAPWKESYDQSRQYIKKQRHYFADKGPSSQSMVFPVVMCGCESWTIKKTESPKIDTFELSCWKRLLRVLWTARRSNQSILKEISPEYSLEEWCWNSSTLAAWCEELIHLKRPWCWERLKVGGEGDDREWDDWMASPTQWTWVWVNSRSWWWTGKPGVLQSMGSHRVRHSCDWTELTDKDDKKILMEKYLTRTKSSTGFNAMQEKKLSLIILYIAPR